MKTRTIKRFFPLICLLVLTCTDCKREHSLKEAVEQEAVAEVSENKLPLDLSLRWLQGAGNFRSLAVVRLFSRQMLQGVIDRTVLGKSAELEDLVFTVPRSSWEGVTFLVSDPTGQMWEPVEDFAVIEKPDSEQVTISPTKIIEVVYQLNSTEHLPPGSRLMAEMRLDKTAYQSNAVVIGSPPEDERNIRLREMELLMVSGRNSELLTVSERMTQDFPDDPGGFWYQAIAQENSGNEKNALQSYRKALEVFRSIKPTAGQSSEPPLRLVEKIRELSSRDSKKDN